MEFVANLRTPTIEAFANQRERPTAYLLSTHRLDRTTLRYALSLAKDGVPVFADNGSKMLIDRVLDAHEADAAPTTRKIRAELNGQQGLVREHKSGKALERLRDRAMSIASAIVSPKPSARCNDMRTSASR